MNESQEPFARAEDDDTEAHRARLPHGGADAESAEGDDDVEGHRFPHGRAADAESAEGDDDVEGHIYVPDPDARGEKTS
jgi:hypothetical protein